ncbi:MAG: hypothetical protein AAF495_19630 [Pseudomonadota bacterium]
MRSRLQAGLVAMILATGLAGCMQGEEVFLRQNQASTALAYTIMDLETTQPESVDELYDAEQELARACAPLQKAGVLGMRQEEISLGLRLEIFDALDDCAAVSHEVESLVWQLDPEIARTYLDVSVLAEVSAE